MSTIVERGLARCPRCVAVADYTFVESGPNSIRYEVHCGKCGEAYCEVNTPLAPDFTATATALALVASTPDAETRVVGARRAWALGRLRRGWGHATAVAAKATRMDWRRLLRRR